MSRVESGENLGIGCRKPDFAAVDIDFIVSDAERIEIMKTAFMIPRVHEMIVRLLVIIRQGNVSLSDAVSQLEAETETLDNTLTQAQQYLGNFGDKFGVKNQNRKPTIKAIPRPNKLQKLQGYRNIPNN